MVANFTRAGALVAVNAVFLRSRQQRSDWIYEVLVDQRGAARD